MQSSKASGEARIFMYTCITSFYTINYVSETITVDPSATHEYFVPTDINFQGNLGQNAKYWTLKNYQSYSIHLA